MCVCRKNTGLSRVYSQSTALYHSNKCLKHQDSSEKVGLSLTLPCIKSHPRVHSERAKGALITNSYVINQSPKSNLHVLCDTFYYEKATICLTSAGNQAVAWSCISYKK